MQCIPSDYLSIHVFSLCQVSLSIEIRMFKMSFYMIFRANFLKYLFGLPALHIISGYILLRREANTYPI